MLDRLMMLPDDRSAIPGAIPATRKYAERTLPSNRPLKVVSSSDAEGPNHDSPALLTRTSTVPTSSTRARTAATSLRSAATNRARPPPASISRTTSAPRSGLRPGTPMSQPSRARRRARRVGPGGGGGGEQWGGGGGKGGEDGGEGAGGGRGGGAGRANGGRQVPARGYADERGRAGDRCTRPTRRPAGQDHRRRQ